MIFFFELFQNILIYGISNKTLIGEKPLRIEFDKIDGFIRIYDGSRYLTLLASESYDGIYNRIRYLISIKSSITYIFSDSFAETKVDSYPSLPIEKRRILHNTKILIRPVFNKDKNHCYYKMFLEKCFMN